MQSNTAAQISTIAAKPILKWAGGKTQMLGELLPKVPSSYGRYIEHTSDEPINMFSVATLWQQKIR